MMKPKALVANAIGRERQRAGMSLSALAVKADLAKSTLSQLEAGKGNPSIETLWAIACALDVPFSFLFEAPQPQSQLIRADEGVALSSEFPGFSAVLLDHCPPTSRRDLYRINLDRGALRNAEPHTQGTIEHVFVCHGTVRVGPLNAAEILNAADYMNYRADVAHFYEAVSETATILLVMETAR